MRTPVSRVARSIFPYLSVVVVTAGFLVGPSMMPSTDSQRFRPEIRFHDVAAAAGLDFVLRNDAAGRKYQVETVLGGVAVIDFDNDGWPDIFAVNGASLPSLEKNHPR